MTKGRSSSLMNLLNTMAERIASRGYAMLYPNDLWTLVFPPVTLKAKWFVLIFMGIELFTGITGTMDGVAHFAHLGGALFGFLMIFYWKKSGKLWKK